MIMQKTTLAFPSIQDLWQFKLTCKQCNFLLNTDRQTLTGSLSAAEIEAAINHFKAKVLEVDMSSTAFPYN